MQRKLLKPVLIAAGAILIFIIPFCILVWNGVILLNGASAAKYPVRGVDVSAYQGDIDWEELSSQNISFAFIKAAEGSSFVNSYFRYNFEQAQKTKLAVGAYHFLAMTAPASPRLKILLKLSSPMMEC